jgi:CubicO group peptidase (beta-lactamase class C family)
MKFAKVKSILDEGERYGAGPGRGCVVYYKHRQVFCHIAGFQDKERGIPLKGDELYHLFSCTKVMTCTAAMILLERGKYQLDEPVGKYIPEFYDVTVGEAAPQSPILIRHLFTMSAGLDYTLDDGVIKAAGAATDNHFPTLETVRYLSRRPLSFQPGTCFQYSLCHDVLGALIEVLSGMSFYEFIKREILDPLEMNSTFFHVPEALQGRMAVLYRYNEQDRCGRPCDQRNPYVLGDAYESGGAGIVSCLDDYGKFVEMLCNNGLTPDGRRIIGRESIDRMAMPAFDAAWQETFVKRVSWGAGYHYGLGVYIVDDAQRANSLASRGTFGWDGAAGSYVSVDRENEIAVFYVQHMFGSAIHAYQDRLRNAVYEEISQG